MNTPILNQQEAKVQLSSPKEWIKYIQKVHYLENRATILDIKREKVRYIIGTIYVLSNNELNHKEFKKVARFTRKIKKTIDESNMKTVAFIGGDWNIVPKPIDRKPARIYEAGNDLIKSLTNIYDDDRLYDIWRLLNMNKEGFTHEVGTKRNEDNIHSISRSRIDYFLINRTTLSKAIKTNIEEL